MLKNAFLSNSDEAQSFNHLNKSIQTIFQQKKVNQKRCEYFYEMKKKLRFETKIKLPIFMY